MRLSPTWCPAKRYDVDLPDRPQPGISCHGFLQMMRRGNCRRILHQRSAGCDIQRAPRSRLAGAGLALRLPARACRLQTLPDGVVVLEGAFAPDAKWPVAGRLNHGHADAGFEALAMDEGHH